MNFDRLDALLKERGISRRKLALSIGMNENKMSSAFKRRGGLSADDTLKIAGFLGVSPYYLEGWSVSFDQEKDNGHSVPAYFYLNGKRQGGMWLDSEISRHDAIEEFLYTLAENGGCDPKSVPEVKLLMAFNQLNDDGQSEAVNRVEEMTHIPKYMKGGGDHGNEA